MSVTIPFWLCGVAVAALVLPELIAFLLLYRLHRQRLRASLRSADNDDLCPTVVRLGVFSDCIFKPEVTMQENDVPISDEPVESTSPEGTTKAPPKRHALAILADTLTTKLAAMRQVGWNVESLDEVVSQLRDYCRSKGIKQ